MKEPEIFPPIAEGRHERDDAEDLLKTAAENTPGDSGSLLKIRSPRGEGEDYFRGRV